MTYRYSEINQHDALYLAVRKYPGGVEAMAQRMNTSAAVLYSKLRPGVTTHHTTFEEASEIIEHLQDAKVPEAILPVQAFCWRLGFVPIQLPSSDHVETDELLKMVCKIMQEEGEVAAAINSALSDDRISPSEEEKIDLSIRRAVQGLLELERRVHLRRLGNSKSSET